MHIGDDTQAVRTSQHARRPGQPQEEQAPCLLSLGALLSSALACGRPAAGLQRRATWPLGAEQGVMLALVLPQVCRTACPAAGSPHRRPLFPLASSFAPCLQRCATTARGSAAQCESSARRPLSSAVSPRRQPHAASGCCWAGGSEVLPAAKSSCRRAAPRRVRTHQQPLQHSAAVAAGSAQVSSCRGEGCSASDDSRYRPCGESECGVQLLAAPRHDAYGGTAAVRPDMAPRLLSRRLAVAITCASRQRAMSVRSERPTPSFNTSTPGHTPCPSRRCRRCRGR